MKLSTIMPTIAKNKYAYHDYQVLETFEAGIVLSGPEVKAAKAGQVNLKGAYITIDQNNEAWLINCNISAYKPAGISLKSYNPTHSRKLLIQKNELISARTKVQNSGLTILPLSVYTKGSLIKIEVGIVKGKKKYDKREDMKKRDTEREMRTRLKRV